MIRRSSPLVRAHGRSPRAAERSPDARWRSRTATACWSSNAPALTEDQADRRRADDRSRAHVGARIECHAAGESCAAQEASAEFYLREIPERWRTADTA